MWSVFSDGIRSFIGRFSSDCEEEEEEQGWACLACFLTGLDYGRERELPFCD